MQPVEIPADMIQRYVERRKADLEMLEQSLAVHDLEKIKSIAHQIKGNASSFGFDDLNQIVVQMENAAVSNNQPILLATIESFRSWLQSARQAI